MQAIIFSLLSLFSLCAQSADIVDYMILQNQIQNQNEQYESQQRLKIERQELELKRIELEKQQKLDHEAKIKACRESGRRVCF